jgi:predicted ATPase/transcriptional regulator with XRE-family HTH domain
VSDASVPGLVPFADLLRRHRLAAGLTQEALAERAGLSGEAVQKLERAVRRPYPDTLERLAAALGLVAEERARFLVAGRKAPRHPAGRPGGVPSAALPLPLTTFVGRGQELADLRALLAGHRLVTVTGPGGIGKTRLALQVVAELAEHSPDGVRLVELAALTDPRLVPQAVAAAVGVREEPGRSLPATLAEALRLRRLLLMLDNCEHLVEACAALVAALMGACVELRVLTTSRESLGVPGEALYRLLPLALPEPGALRPEVLLRADAVRLFVDRAGTVQSHFTLTDANAAAVARLCRRLDGIPLALELAAGRLGGLPVEELAARLEQGFRLLAGGSRVALPRQQTLRATLDWSYDLLTEPERRLFDRLAVFAGGFTLAAAEAVGAEDGLAREEVLDLLLRLVDRSLVVAEEQPEGSMRYRLLEPLRQYGRERLAAGGHAEGGYERHAAYYLALVEEAEPHLRGRQQAVWHRRLAAEHDNLWAALRWWLGRGDAEHGLRLWVPLWDYLYRRGYLQEAAARLLDLLALAGAAPTPLRVRALVLAAFFVPEVRSDPLKAKAFAQEALAQAKELGDARGFALALFQLGLAALGDGRYVEAQHWLGESVDAWRGVDDASRLSHALCFRGRAANARKDHAGARADLEEALALAGQAGDTVHTAVATEFLGEVASTVGEDGEASTRLEAALALFEEVGDKHGVASVHIFLGGIDLRQGDVAAAQRRYRTGLTEAMGMGFPTQRIGDALEGLAMVAARQGQPERTLRLAGAAAAFRATARFLAPPHDRARLEQALLSARSSLGEPAAAAAWAAGHAMPLEEAVAYAWEAQPNGATRPN